MPRTTSTRSTSVAAPHRSPGAARAHSDGRVTSTIDLTRTPARVVRRVDHATRNGVVLGSVAAVLWLYDLSRLAGHG